MEKKERVTIKDVARVAHVTPQTVSRALRDAPDISEFTRERVLRIASDMNYVKNSTASSLRRGATHLIAVIYDNVINLYFSIMSNFLQFSLKERGYQMLTIVVRSVRLDREAYLSAIAHNVDGIISFLEPDSEVASVIRDHGIPVLLFGRRTDITDIDYITTDDEAGGRIAAEKLARSGCKKLAFFTESMELTCAYDRFKGFRSVVQQFGLSEPLVINTQVPDLEERLVSLFTSPDQRPDGVFCFNDMLAFDLLYLFERKGIAPVSVIGYDDIQTDIHIPHRLVTIGTNKREVTQRAAEIIISRIEMGSMIRRTAETEHVFLVEGGTVS